MHSQPTDTTGSDRRRKLLTAAVCIAAVAFILIYAFFDPATYHYPRCGFRMLTGLSCPGCGSQRALHALLTGNPAEALKLNALFVAELPVIGLLLVSNLPGKRFHRLKQLLNTRIFILLLLATIIIWTVVRNIFDI